MARVVETRRSRLLFVALLVCHFVIVSHQVDAGGGASLLEHTAFLFLAPIQHAVASLIHSVDAGFAAYVGLRGVHEENRRLREHAQALEAELERTRALAEEASRLRGLLGLKELLPLRGVAAEVLSRDGTPWFRSVTIGKGSENGLRLNAPVVSPFGVVGRIVGLGPSAARVQLILDRDAGVGALVERSRVTGVCVGQVGFTDSGQADLVMRYVSALADVGEGDRVLTSGLDGIYPKGLVIGRVRAAGPPSGLFREVVVAPTARFDELEQVLVLEPAPSPSVTESVR